MGVKWLDQDRVVRSDWSKYQQERVSMMTARETVKLAYAALLVMPVIFLAALAGLALGAVA